MSRLNSARQPLWNGQNASDRFKVQPGHLEQHVRLRFTGRCSTGRIRRSCWPTSNEASKDLNCLQADKDGHRASQAHNALLHNKPRYMELHMNTARVIVHCISQTACTMYLLMPVAEDMQRLPSGSDVGNGQPVPVEPLTAVHSKRPVAQTPGRLNAAPVCGHVGHQVRPVVHEDILCQACAPGHGSVTTGSFHWSHSGMRATKMLSDNNISRVLRLSADKQQPG